MLVLSRKTEEEIIISGGIVITIFEIKKDFVKIGIQAPTEVKVYRGEIYKAIQEENKIAASVSVLPSLKEWMEK